MTTSDTYFITREHRGDKAFKEGEFKRAVEEYLASYNPLSSSLTKAELAHKLALSFRHLGDFEQYLQYEEQASAFYAQVSIDQAADFLKITGDTLNLAEESEFASRAHQLASHYYSSAAETASEPSLRLAWKAWSMVCRNKASKDQKPASWTEAASIFTEASNMNEQLSVYRKAKALQCTAMAEICSSPSASNIKEAAKQLEKASELEPSNLRTRISMIAAHTLTASEDELPQLLRQLILRLEALECTSLRDKFAMVLETMTKKQDFSQETVHALNQLLLTAIRSTTL